MKCNRNRLHCQFNRNRRLRSRLKLEIFTYITVHWTAVVVDCFPPLSSFFICLKECHLTVCVR